MSYYPKRDGLSDKVVEASAMADEVTVDKIKDIATEYHLTERETDVFRLLASGYSRPFIQKSLFLSEGTIKTHTRNIYAKLMINNRDELLVLVHSKTDEQSFSKSP